MDTIRIGVAGLGHRARGAWLPAPGTLPVAESTRENVFGVPWFKHDHPEIIKEYAAAYRKVAEHADQLR